MKFKSHSRSSKNSPVKEWKTRSWNHFPVLILLTLFGPLVAMAMAVMLLYIADESPIDNWPLAPTVYLAIITTLSNAMLRFAFSESSGLYWWSMLLSPSGVSLPELHTIWDISHSIFALIKFPTDHARQGLLRLTALLVILLAINGPFLQRAVTVEFTTRVDNYPENPLPIRREPMWNLTTKVSGFNGHLWTSPPYQREFADVVSGLNQRQPMTLSSPVCGLNANCKANVIIAGFSRVCEDSKRSPQDIKSLGVARTVVLPDWPPHVCNATGFAGMSGENNTDTRPGSANYCGYLQSEYQLDVTLSRGSQYVDGPLKETNMTPSMFEYTSYIRRDVADPMLLVRQCNFSTSFIELPIRITNRTVVTLSRLEETNEFPERSRNDIESIPVPLGASGRLNFFIRGVSQIMADQYAGYMMYDNFEGTHISMGLNTRQYINQSSIGNREQGENITSAQAGYEFSFLDPLEDFVNTLNEVSLRYALKSIPESPERLAELEDYKKKLNTTDYRDVALNLMSTTFEKAQEVILEEERIIAVYKSHYAYTAVAVGMTSLTSFLTLLLLRTVFSTHGRSFSMSPLEIAKAFSAPLLGHVGSNAKIETIAKETAAIQVKYGEVKKNKQSLDNLQYEPAWVSNSESAGFSEDSVMLSGANEKMTLRIDEPDHIIKPTSGRVYH